MEDELRRAGQLPCGSRIRPLVSAEMLVNHLAGAPVAANAPRDWTAGTSYPLDRGIFTRGNHYVGNACTPELAPGERLPRVGLADGDRVPGPDVLVVRYLQGSGWAAVDSPPCRDYEPMASIAIRKLPGDSLPAQFPAAHVALLANCLMGKIFAVIPEGNALRPRSESFGPPDCVTIDSETRVFDLDAQLHTSVYYLEMKVRDGANGRGSGSDATHEWRHQRGDHCCTPGRTAGRSVRQLDARLVRSSPVGRRTVESAPIAHDSCYQLQLRLSRTTLPAILRAPRRSSSVGRATHS